MTLLVIGLLLFVTVHVLTGLRLLTPRLGVSGAKLIVTAGALIGLALIVWGKAQAPFIPVYEPAPWARAAALHAMPLALIILALAYTPGRLRPVLRHPMLLAVLLWSGLHLLANGDLASIWLFGAFAVFVPAMIVLTERRGYSPAASGRLAWDGVGVLVGAVAAYALMKFHGVLFGVALI